MKFYTKFPSASTFLFIRSSYWTNKSSFSLSWDFISLFVVSFKSIRFCIVCEYSFLATTSANASSLLSFPLLLSLLSVSTPSFYLISSIWFSSGTYATLTSSYVHPLCSSFSLMFSSSKTSDSFSIYVRSSESDLSSRTLLFRCFDSSLFFCLLELKFEFISTDFLFVESISCFLNWTSLFILERFWLFFWHVNSCLLSL